MWPASPRRSAWGCRRRSTTRPARSRRASTSRSRACRCARSWAARFGVPVFVDNDANCAALAEAHILGEEDLVMLTLGTGVGGGVVIGGITFRGAHGLGAELGHMTLNPDGPPCPGNCPNRGCIEAYCSGRRSSATRPSWRATSPTATWPAASASDGKVTGPRPRGGRRGRRPRRAADLRQLRPHARHRPRRLRERLRARAASRSAAACRARATCSSTARSRRPPPARCPRCWRAHAIGLAQGGADAGVIGAGVLAAQEVAAQNCAILHAHSITTERAE